MKILASERVRRDLEKTYVFLRKYIHVLKAQEKEHTGNRIKEVASSYDEKPEDNRDKQKGIEATKAF